MINAENLKPIREPLEEAALQLERSRARAHSVLSLRGDPCLQGWTEKAEVTAEDMERLLIEMERMEGRQEARSGCS